jgi:hypothetical protein
MLTTTSPGPRFIAFLGLSVSLLPALGAQVGTVVAEQKISESTGGFGGALDAGDELGFSSCPLGDLDGDGVPDLAVGARFDDDGGADQGAVWILFLEDDGTVKAQQKISETTGGFGGALDPGDEFGYAVCSLGDLDGDGTGDLAVGARFDDDGGFNQGAVWILFLDTDGTVKSAQKISATSGTFGGSLSVGDEFGAAVSGLDDVDGDGAEDLAVGAPHDDDGGAAHGAVWILFLHADGTVKAEQKISDTAGGFGGVLDDDSFGRALSSLGDLDGDGLGDLAVGAPTDDDGASDQGAVWLLFLDADGTVKAEQKISATAGGFAGDLDAGDFFGSRLSTLGDLDGDRITDLAASSPRDNDGGVDQGAVWILFLHADGTVKAEQKISATAGGFGGVLDPDDRLGASLAALGDLDADGAEDLAAGAHHDDDGDTDQGAVWILFLEGDSTPPTLSCPPAIAQVDSKGGIPGASVSYSVTATDDSDPTPTIVCVPPSGSIFPRGTTLVTCTATDASGNQSSCTFPVTVFPTVRRR